MNYRNNAKQSLERAKRELEGNDNSRLSYAALELRMSIEGLIYERASLYREELPIEKIDTWQPKKILDMLIEVHPNADQSSEISFGLQDEPGKPPKDMKYLGKERILSLKEIKKYYALLGSCLHTPTIKQLMQDKGGDSEKIRKRCLEVVEILDQVVASKIFNVILKQTATIECGECGIKIVRRTPQQGGSVTANCIGCDASYTLTSLEDNKVEWRPLDTGIGCANPNCNTEIRLWDNQVVLGSFWTCLGCGCKNTIVLGVTYEPQAQSS